MIVQWDELCHSKLLHVVDPVLEVHLRLSLVLSQELLHKGYVGVDAFVLENSGNGLDEAILIVPRIFVLNLVKAYRSSRIELVQLVAVEYLGLIVVSGEANDSCSKSLDGSDEVLLAA